MDKESLQEMKSLALNYSTQLSSIKTWNGPNIVDYTDFIIKRFSYKNFRTKLLELLCK